MRFLIVDEQIDELDDLNVDFMARERLQSFDREKAISHEEMVQRFSDCATRVGG
jgi:antitoxin StbD